MLYALYSPEDILRRIKITVPLGVVVGSAATMRHPPGWIADEQNPKLLEYAACGAFGSAVGGVVGFWAGFLAGLWVPGVAVGALYGACCRWHVKPATQSDEDK
jgi:H+/Cl- antiporter ClcA